MDKKIKTLYTLLILGAFILLSRAGMPSYVDELPDYIIQSIDQVRDSVARSSGKERIFIENVDVWSYDKEINPDAQVLRGNVIFKHNNGYMYCDSALLYEQQNSFEAFGEVRFTQGDTLNVYCRYMRYNGGTMLAELRENVRMEHRGTTLYTDSFDYDRIGGVGYYFDNGTIVDTLNTLYSVYGEYRTDTKKAIFNENVKLENPNFTLYSDTLHYDTTTKIATILGPTRIVGDSGHIETNRGVYDTEQDRAYLLDRSRMYSGSRFMTSDSLYYDRKNGFAEMYRDVVLRDTADKVELRGGYAEYYEHKEYGKAKDNAYLLEYSSKDTLYAHALLMEMIKTDSLTKLIKGLGNVRVYRQDIQAVCDTMVYNSKDSIMKCLGSPFMWNGKTQITGDSATMFMRNGALKEAIIEENAIVAQELDRVHYNQMKGNSIKAYFSNNNLDSIRTEGNAETIYYSMEKDSTLSSHIKTQSSAIFMKFKDENIEFIKLLEQTKGLMKPVPMLIDTDKFFPNFIWFSEGRPRNFSDIFRKTPRPKSPGATTSEDPQERQNDSQSSMTNATLSTNKEE